MCPCVRLILVLVGKTLILVLVWGTYYVPATYVPGISRQTTVWYQGRTYNIGLHPKKKPSRPWTHTFDDSYFYQLLLVLATATVSLVCIFLFLFERSEFLIDTSPPKNMSMCVCSTNLGFSGEKIILVLVWGTYYSSEASF